MNRRTKLQSSLVNSKQGSILTDQGKVLVFFVSYLEKLNSRRANFIFYGLGAKHITKISPETIEASKNFINNRPTTSGDSKSIEGFKRGDRITPMLPSEAEAGQRERISQSNPRPSRSGFGARPASSNHASKRPVSNTRPSRGTNDSRTNPPNA